LCFVIEVGYLGYAVYHIPVPVFVVHCRVDVLPLVGFFVCCDAQLVVVTHIGEQCRNEYRHVVAVAGTVHQGALGSAELFFAGFVILVTDVFPYIIPDVPESGHGISAFDIGREPI